MVLVPAEKTCHLLSEQKINLFKLFSLFNRLIKSEASSGPKLDQTYSSWLMKKLKLGLNFEKPISFINLQQQLLEKDELFGKKSKFEEFTSSLNLLYETYVVGTVLKDKCKCRILPLINSKALSCSKSAFYTLEQSKSGLEGSLLLWFWSRFSEFVKYFFGSKHQEHTVLLNFFQIDLLLWRRDK